VRQEAVSKTLQRVVWTLKLPKKTELKLIGVARGSLEELLLDFEDFLRQNNLELWSKEHPKTKAVRSLAYKSNKSYKTYQNFLDDKPEIAANTIICLIHQANFLLDRQLKTLEKQFLEQGGFTEKLYHSRKAYKTQNAGANRL